MDKKIHHTLKVILSQKVTLLLLILAIVCSVIAIYGYYDNKKSVPTASCPSLNSGTLVPFSFSEMTEKSPAIVSARLEGHARSGYTFKVIDNLKGNYFSPGQTVDVCVNLTTPQKGTGYEPALLLLKGRDKKTNHWSTVQDYMGVFSSTPEGRFKINKDTVSLEEVKKQL